MNNIPVLSVIIPVYNVGPFIERCAKSLFEQTLCSKEIVEFIFVNDCTPDDSIVKLQKVIANNPLLKEHINIINHPQNRRLFLARRTGIEAAKGKYIIHIDSDDWVEPEMMETMLSALIQDQADMVYCGMVHDCADGVPRVSFMPQETEARKYLAVMLRFPHLWSLCNKMYRADIVRHAENDLGEDVVTAGEDLRRNIKLLPLCQKITAVEKCFYHYCDNPSSISKSPKDYFADMVSTGDFMEKNLGEEFQESILAYKRDTLFYAIQKNSQFARKMFPTLWRSAYQGIWQDRQRKMTYRFFLWLGSISYPVAQWLWKNSFIPYQWLKNKCKVF